MKRKTAMQELVEWISNNGMSPDCGVPDIKLKAQQLLEKEKEQIIKSNRDGVDMAISCQKNDVTSNFVTGEQYYNETYKQD